MLEKIEILASIDGGGGGTILQIYITPPPHIYNSILPPEILTLFPYRGVKITTI